MSNRKTWKSVGALLLTVAMLAGMLSVMGALPTTAKTTSAMKFTADFSDLTALVNENGGAFTDGMYRAPYTPKSDTTSLDGKFNTWANEKFYAFQTYVNSERTFFGQDSNNLQTYKDTWSGNQYLAAGEDGYLQFFQGLSSGQMLRKGITLSPLYNGELAKVKNFEASLTFRFTKHTGNAGNAVAINFHETEVGNLNMTKGDYEAGSTGNTVVFGNGAGNYKAPGNEGVAFYQKGDVISGTSVADEGNMQTSTSEVKLGDKGARFENALTLNKDYTLTVKALNGTATITVTDTATGDVIYTVDKTYVTAEGYVSFGFFNAPFKVKSFELAEMDDDGALVDFGTYAASLNTDVEKFTASFADLPDVKYVESSKKYYYSANHDAEGFDTNAEKALTLGGTTYQIDMNDDALVDYLESKFAFYYQQEGHYFQRQKVNGLYVDADGNQFTKGSVVHATKIYKPDTGEVKDYPEYIDYIGASASGKTHLWGLSANKFLGTSNTAAGDGMYRHNDTMTVKNADGTLAQLENFELEADVILRPDAAFDYANLTVAFRAPSSLIGRGNVDTGLFAISPYGGYIVGGDNELKLSSGYIFNKSTTTYDEWTAADDASIVTFTNQTTKNTATNARAAVYAKTTGVNFGTSEHHLKLRVVGRDVTITISDASGNVEFTATEQTNYTGSGYLSLGGSNNAARFGNIVVTRLDKDGNAVDFSDVNDGYDYGANFGSLAEYRFGGYYRNSGADLFYLSGAGNPYDFSDETQATDKATADYLREKFDFYATKEGSSTQLENPYTNTKDSGMYTSDGAHHAQWKLRAGRFLTATFSGGSYGNDAMLRKTMSLVPKMNGEAVKTANFETEFDVTFNLNTGSINVDEIAVLLAFRSDEAGRPAEGYHGTKNNKDAILINKKGIAIYDGVAVDYSYRNAAASRNATCIKQDDGSYCSEFTAWDNGGNDAWNLHVYAKLVANELTVKVTDFHTDAVLFETTKTINRLGSGYLYYSVGGAEVGLADIRLNLLDRDGDNRDADEIAKEAYASVVTTEEDLKAAGGWDTSKNLYPGNYPYIDVATAKSKGVYDSIKAYLNSRYDLYYQNEAELVKHSSVFGNDAGEKGWYGGALYWGWAQFSKTSNVTLSDNATSLTNIASLVPKTAEGQQMKGLDCVATMNFRFADSGDAAGLFGFRMKEPGKFTDDLWQPLDNTSFLKITLTGVTLYDNGTETVLATYDYTSAKPTLVVRVEVRGDSLTGTVTKDSTNHNFSATLQNNEAGYFAQGFAGKAPNLYPMSIQVGGLNTGKAVQSAGGKLTVERAANNDSTKDGYLAWKVTVRPDADEQLKPDTLRGTDADGSTLYPTRVGFRTDDYSADSFLFYSKGDAYFQAEFYTPHTEDEVSIACIGTQVNAEKEALRFVNRVNLYTGEDGKVYTDIDGVATEVADYGMLLALDTTLNGRELTNELATPGSYIVKRSVLSANKYYDYSDAYVDIAVQVTGLDQAPDVKVCSRAYLQLADGTFIYSGTVSMTYNEAKA